MTPNGVVDTAAFRDRVNTDVLITWLAALSKMLRPSDGWLAAGLLTLNLLVVIWSVEDADWVPTPNLAFVLLLAMLAGGLLSRLRMWDLLVLPIGLAIGLLVVVWQLSSYEPLALASSNELWSRLSLWFEAARTGSINIDSVPFAFGIVTAAWLCGYLSSWAFFRYRNFWGVFVLGGAGLLSNLTYLPPRAESVLLVWLFFGFLLVARVRSVRRRQEWEGRNVTYDGHLSLLSLSDSFMLAIVVVLVASLSPVGHKYGPANEVYEYFRTPLKSFEDDFNRLFAGLPARKPLGYRIWGDVMPFQGTIHPTETQVLWVESPVPLYWKARTYGTYTSKGWMSDDTVLKPMGWVPEIRSPQPHRARFEVSYAVTPLYDSQNLFAGEQAVGADRDVLIETYDSPTYTLDFSRSADPSGLPPKLSETAANLEETLLLGGGDASETELENRLTSEFLLKEVSRSNGTVDKITVSEVVPARPDVLALRSAGRSIKARDTYAITSSVSMATPEALRASGAGYPTWAVEKYTQLPDDLPQRVRDKAAEVTAGAATPYDKAKAIEQYLSTFPYTLTVDPPSFDADGVDHFLFNLGQGYSEYFSSAMAVMLRSVGVPARLATGYTTGDKAVNQDIYVVFDSNSHGWVEAYMPGYGWIPFEPTPGNKLPPPLPPTLVDGPGGVVGTDRDLVDPECIEEDDDCFDENFEFPAGRASGIPLPLGVRLVGAFLWLSIGILVAAVKSILVWMLWRRYMVPSGDPRTAFRRLAALGALASVGPVPHQTPYQYLQRLSQALPGHREPVSVIVDYYVRSRYGQKPLDDQQRSHLARSWLRVRIPLLLYSLRRRTV